MTAKFIVKLKNQTILKIYVQPGASKSEIAGLYGEPPRLKIKIKAPPQDGEANAEILSFISGLVGISKSRVEMLRGQTSRQKDILIDLPVEQVGPCFPIK
ncbi:MAG: YggU family protein [Rhizobacter sp.]|nr:YggU family protein [Bacteriovorax sp.]